MTALVPKIVVGVDGSEASGAALRWAFDEAVRSQADLEVVSAWNYPVGSEPFVLGGPMAVEQAVAEATETVHRMVREVRDAHPGVDVVVREMPMAGPPAAALLRRAEDADMLVVGSRGRGGLTALLLGSVSQHCVTHALCPVAVIHPDRARRDRRRVGVTAPTAGA
jgi:nucleotide-binding universal stress UspA family protein